MPPVLGKAGALELTVQERAALALQLTRSFDRAEYRDVNEASAHVIVGLMCDRP